MLFGFASVALLARLDISSLLHPVNCHTRLVFADCLIIIRPSILPSIKFRLLPDPYNPTTVFHTRMYSPPNTQKNSLSLLSFASKFNSNRSTRQMFPKSCQTRDAVCLCYVHSPPATKQKKGTRGPCLQAPIYLIIRRLLALASPQRLLSHQPPQNPVSKKGVPLEPHPIIPSRF